MFWLYAGFVALVIALLALDLGVFHRKAHAIGVKEALGWSAFWIGLGLAFSGFIYVAYEHHWMGLGLHAGALEDGASAVAKYVTGFVVEKSLAVDNLFVIAMIFSFFAVPAMYQHRVLFWGVVGALAMRGIMIAAGAALIARFSWVVYVFGAFLVLTGIRMLRAEEGPVDFARSRGVRLVRRLLPVTERFHEQHFFVRAGSEASQAPATPGAQVESDRTVTAARRGALLATPLLLALVVVEIADVVFAVDSIPAIFAITTDPFLVLTSNVFAVLGLRSLYFALAGMIDKLVYLKPALAAVLVLVGGKMLAHGWLEHLLGPNYTFWVLGLVLAVLAIGVVASLLKPSKRGSAPQGIDRRARASGGH